VPRILVAQAKQGRTLTHDTIYKPSVEKTPEMERAVSKAMALIEATTDYFENVDGLIQRLISPSRKLTEELGFLYREKVGVAAELTKAESLLVDAYGSEDPNLVSQVRALLDSKTYVAERIAERSKTKILFRQPSILLVYKAVFDGARRAVGLASHSERACASLF